jgi:hypothetical protein
LSLRDIGVPFGRVEMRYSCCEGSFNHCRLEAEDGVADYRDDMAESYSIEGVCKYLEYCQGIA